MTEKEYIISLIDDYLENPVLSDNDKSIAYFKDVLFQIKENPLYINEFIVGINENLIDELTSKLNREEKISFIRDISLLKEKILVLINNKSKVVLDKQEKNIVDRFVSLINNYVDKDNSLTMYNRLKNKLIGNLPLDEIDYDIVEELIYRYNGENADIEYEEAMDYLNRYNIGLVRHITKSLKKNVVYTFVGETEKIEKVKEEDNVNDNQSDSVDPFAMVSFEYVPKERSRENKKKKILVEKVENSIESLFRKYYIDFDSIPEKYRNDLKYNFSYDKYDSILKYLEENNYIKYLKNNLGGLAFILCNCNYNDLSFIIDSLAHKYNVSTVSICRLFKTYLRIFVKEEFYNFEGNVKIINECGIEDLDSIILNNISFFHEEYVDNLDKLNMLSKLGINGKNVVKSAINVFTVNFPLVIKNIKILDTYGFDLRDEEDFRSFSVLEMNNLATALDMFIETGLSGFIHDEPTLTLRNIKSLIIKRILFAYKNGLYVWSNHSENNPVPVNSYFENAINNRSVLDVDQINLLIQEHPILSSVERFNRKDFYNETYFGSIRRRTELIFDDKIISRIKAYSIFKVLVDKHVDEANALIYALSYNSVLTTEQYQSIKNFVNRDLGAKRK